MDLYFSPAAQLELDEAFAYLEGEKTGLGYRFTVDVDEALRRIQIYPLAWHPLGHNLRRCHLKHFRYGVIYRICGGQARLLPLRMTAGDCAIGETDWAQSEFDACRKASLAPFVLRKCSRVFGNKQTSYNLRNNKRSMK